MNIDLLFKVKGLAVIGASPGKYFSDRLFEHLVGLRERIAVCPVNPHRKSVYKMKCYRSVQALKGKCDAAFLLVDAASAPRALRECGENGLGTAVVLDSAAKDKKSFDDLRKIAGKLGVTLLGPASLGYIDTHAGLTIYSGRLPAGPLPRGRVSVISESGGLLGELFRVTCGEHRWGIRRAVSVGEQAGVTTALALKQLNEDALTGCIVLLLTGLNEKLELLSAIDEVTLSGKPVVVFPAFPGGAAGDRTGAAGVMDGESFNALFLAAASRRGLLYVARCVEEAAEAAGVMAPGDMEKAGEGLSWRWKKIKGKKIAVLSVSGGVGQWVKARATDMGLKVPAFGSKVRRDLSALSPGVSFTNPVDLTGRILSSTEDFKKVLRAMVKAGGCHAVVVSIHPPSGDTPSDRRNEKWLMEMAEVELEGRRDRSAAALVPVQVSRGGPPAGEGGWAEVCPVKGLDLALELISWAAGLGGIDHPEERKERPDGMDYEAARSLLRGPGRRLSEPSSRKVLTCYGIDFPEWILAGSQSRAVGFFRKAKGPVNLKIATPDAGIEEMEKLARINIRGEAAVKKAYVDLFVEARKRGEEMRLLGVLVETTLAEAPAVSVSTRSLCDGSPPVVEVSGVSGPSFSAGICPCGPREASMVTQRIIDALPPGLEPVKMSQLVRRLSLFASDFREEVDSAFCRFVPGGAGGILCVSAEVAIKRTVN